MTGSVQTSTLVAAVLTSAFALGVPAVASAQWATSAPPAASYAPPPRYMPVGATASLDADASRADLPPHPALALGVGDLVVAGAFVPIGFAVGVGVNDNGWEKASTFIGAAVGLGALGGAATAHGVADGDRRLKDPAAAGFGWFFTSLAAGGVGAGMGLVIGGDDSGKPFGGVIAASSLIFLAPGIPLIADGERSAVERPAQSEWGRPVQEGDWRVPTPAPDGGWVEEKPTAPRSTRMNSPAMVGFGSAFLIVGGLGSILGLSGVAIGASVGEENVTALGGGILAGGLVTALAVGLPLVVVGAREVPDLRFSAGPGGVSASGSF